jgi:hypothetical protein
MGLISELGRLSRDVFHYALGRLAYCRMADKAQASFYEFRGRLILGTQALPRNTAEFVQPRLPSPALASTRQFDSA